MIKWFLLLILISYPAFAQVRQIDTSTQGQRQDITISTGARQKLPAARAYSYVAPNTAKCYETYGGGVQGQFVGFSLSGSYESLPCNILAFFAVLKSIGRDAEAETLLRQYKPVDVAYKEVEKKHVEDSEKGFRIDYVYPPDNRRLSR